MNPKRRTIDPTLLTGPDSPAYLLSTENPATLQSLRQSVHDHLQARTPAELAAAEYATAAAWLGLRALRHLGSAIDTEVSDQTAAVNRDFVEIDPISRTALIYHDPATARILRGFERTVNDNHRVVYQFCPLQAGKTSI
ncbi:MAG: hypothetical protein IPP47_01985 [Bryobacterales bacterium]|nr:hypothetical protein [Bryobacterales bacterium]